MRPKLKPDILLAKSFDPQKDKWIGAYHLVGHTAAVVEAVTTLVDTLGNRLISQFGLSCGFMKLRATARLAAYIHDWGKANDHFQAVVRHQRNPLEQPQMIRHEVASVLLAWEFREWLQQGDGDFFTALAAAGGHHLKLGGRAGKRTDDLGEFREGTGDDRFYWYFDHPYFYKLLRYGVKALGLPRDLKLSRKLSTCWQVTELKKHKRQEVLEAFLTWKSDPVLTGVVKSLLISGDAVGSALPPTGTNIKQWIQQELKQTLTEAKLQKVIKARLNGNDLLDFQKKLGATPTRVTLAQAGCGTGKTVGAYNWAKRHAIGHKLFFCYPTTGTSTEGFIDYVHNQVDSVLLHSRADVDLQRVELDRLTSTGEEAEVGDGTENETAKKLESFKAWGKEAIVCTVDTVLGLLQCNRRPMYCFPAIAQGAFVFDEVHCYDDALFGALLRFLEIVKAPILLMSASFLPWQLEAIKKVVGEPVKVIPGPKDLEEKPRYRFHYVDAPDWERVEKELAAGGKVLWVCNQVNTAIAVYQEAKRRKLDAELYHSRYRYHDRVDHHRAVVDGFKKDEPILAIATQVAEMSLDLSATLLVSQIANPAGLIQRLGRLNRRYCGHALDAIFYADEKVGFPYIKAELDAGSALIQSFTGEVNQAQLAEWLEQLDRCGKLKKDYLVLLDGKWCTYSAALREAGYTVTALLEQDAAKAESSRMSELPRYTVPLPMHDTKNWKRHKKGYLIAPAQKWKYSAEFGAEEVK